MGFNDQFALCLQQRKSADFELHRRQELHRDRPQATLEKSLRADLNRSCLDGVCHLLPTEASPKRSCGGFYDAHRALGLLGPTCDIERT
jgi:hypothetical protein